MINLSDLLVIAGIAGLAVAALAVDWRLALALVSLLLILAGVVLSRSGDA